VSYTVVPLHNLNLPIGSRIPFGTKFVLQDVPEWIKNDEGYLKDNLSHTDRQGTLEAKHALVADYFADPEWTGKALRSIQNQRFQSAFLANIAIWLIQPSSVSFTVAFHALTDLYNGNTVDPPVILHHDREGPFYCREEEQPNVVSAKHVIKAATLFEILDTVSRGNAVWSALRAFSAALMTYYADYRYPLFWQGLESLFGSDVERFGITKRLCDRISIFIASDPTGKQEIYNTVSACYDTRSEILHGRWEDDPKIQHRMTDTEAIVRTVLRNLLEQPGMLAAFISPKRNEFLESWVTSNNFSSPALP
jgi:hypothetical protein